MVVIEKRRDSMKYVIFDCDSTAGLPGKPMDDALALLYLLGRPQEAEILGITCTFANGTAAEVYESTSGLLREINVVFFLHFSISLYFLT